MTCILLHNFLRRSQTSRASYSPSGMFDSEKGNELCLGSWRQDQKYLTSFLPFRRVPRRPGVEAMEIRDSFADYFMTNSTVTWQNDI